MPASRPLEERFWEKVKKTESCWIWTAHEQRYGYIAIGNGQKKGAHIVSWFLRYNVWPDQCVLHKCDNTLCVNPDHLFLGSQRDNVKDMINKNRMAIGERRFSSKLTEQDIYGIKEMFENGSQNKDIAQAYNISTTTVWHIVNGNKWKHITGGIPFTRKRCSKGRHEKAYEGRCKECKKEYDLKYYAKAHIESIIDPNPTLIDWSTS